MMTVLESGSCRRVTERQGWACQSATIRTAHRKTNCPIARLIPLEVVSNSTGGNDNDTHLTSKGPDNSATEEA